MRSSVTTHAARSSSNKRRPRSTIQVTRADGDLRLAVRDDGPGLADPARVRSSSGVGLANTRARLGQLYADRHRFVVANHPDGGVLVELSIPLRF